MIGDTIRELQHQLPDGTRLVAVSKYHPASAIQEAYNAGQRIFGESHVQEMQSKRPLLPADIEWHFIGHLQTNKVKYIAPYVSLIHAIDSPKLLAEVSKQGVKCGRRIPCLLQLHIAQEETKFGFTIEECKEYLLHGEWETLHGVELQGLMCMASNTDNEQRIAGEFETAYRFFLRIKKTYFLNNPNFRECSWGMSEDYHIAVRHGSTLVRIGSRIFGERQYPTD